MPIKIQNNSKIIKRQYPAHNSPKEFVIIRQISTDKKSKKEINNEPYCLI